MTSFVSGSKSLNSASGSILAALTAMMTPKLTRRKATSNAVAIRRRQKVVNALKSRRSSRYGKFSCSTSRGCGGAKARSRHPLSQQPLGVVLRKRLAFGCVM